MKMTVRGVNGRWEIVVVSVAQPEHALEGVSKSQAVVQNACQLSAGTSESQRRL